MAWRESLEVGFLTVEKDLAVNDDVVIAGDLTAPVIKKAVVAASGGIAANDLVCITGWDATNSLPIVSKADADATALANRACAFIATAAITAGAAGYVYSDATVTGLNTSAGSVGDPVYLSDTAGGWTLSAPTTAGDVVQQVGVVTVDHASTGAIRFFPFWTRGVVDIA